MREGSPVRLLNPMQSGCFHRDCFWRFMFRYIPTAIRNRVSVFKSTQRGGETGIEETSITAYQAASAKFWQARLPEKTVALTFDDGPHPTGTPAVLEVLARHEVRASFFVLGVAACAHPHIVQRANAEGHAICYHGWEHVPERSAEGIAGFLRTSKRIGQTARRPVMQQVVRYPHGIDQSWHLANRDVGATMNVGWTMDSLDYVAIAHDRKLARMINILSKTGPLGHIILMHDGARGGTTTARLLDHFLRRISDMGWRTVLLTEFL